MTIIEPNAPMAGPALPSELEFGTQSETVPEQFTGDYGAPSAMDPSALASAPSQEDSTLTAEDVLRHINGRASETEALPQQIPIPKPFPFPRPFPLPFRAASGRYRSQAVGFQLELRVDVDGRRPLRRLSGDYYSVSGATTNYFGSWTVDAVTITTSSNAITVVGTARTTWSTTFTVATVTIPRTTIFRPGPPATIRWSTPSGAIGATYVCDWESGAYRTVEFEQDCESGVTA